MTYELAKELKDAGFPQDKRFPLDEHTIEDLKKRSFEEVHFPELSELIEACGEQFGGLIRLRDGTWNAATPVIISEIGYHNPQTECGGSTPEEAVAKLYLALNKKV